MRKLFSTAVIALASAAAFGQTIQEAQTLINNENYYKAKQVLYKLYNTVPESKMDAAYYLGNTYLKDDDVDSAKLFYKLAYNPDMRTATSYLANGRMAVLNGNLVEAKANFDRALQTTKMKNANVYYEIGDAYFSPKVVDVAAAKTNLEAAYALDNKNASIMLLLGDVYLQDINGGGAAMNKYEAAADANKTSALAQVKIGRLAMNGRMYPQAIEAFNKALAIEPSNAVVHRELGNAYYHTKAYDKFLDSYKKYIELSGDPKAVVSILELYARNKEWNKVAEEAEKALKTTPDNPLIMRYLFYSQFETKRYKDGYEVMKRYMALPGVKPKPTDLVYAARLAGQMNDTTASAYFDTAIAQDPTNTDLMGEYGKFLFLSRKYKEAAIQYEKKKAALSDNKLPSLDVYYLGRAYYSSGDSIKADTTFGEFIQRNATSPDGYYWRAIVNLKIGKLEDYNSFPWYSKYIEVAGSDPVKNKKNLVEAYNYLGVYYFEKDKAKAKENFNKALELDPNDQDAIDLLKQLDGK